MENNISSVCAIVITYNRKSLLIECLEALRKQIRPIQAIFLIDNASTDGTENLLLEKGYIKELPAKQMKEPWEKEFDLQNLTNGQTIKFYYIKMNKNTGSSGGFYEGIKRGYNKGYDWIWLMDDDANCDCNALSELIKNKDLKNISALSSLKKEFIGDNVCYTQGGFLDLKNFKDRFVIGYKADFKKNIIEVENATFVGLFIPSYTIKKIGFPDKRFFIYHDDDEYCLRMVKYGKIMVITKSIIVHKGVFKKNINLTNKKILFLKSNRVDFNFYVRYYYEFRNLIYIKLKYAGFLYAIGTILNIIPRKIIGVLLFDDNKINIIKLLIKSSIDGLIQKFDNEYPQKIRYE